jgi:hypothetical protein
VLSNITNASFCLRKQRNALSYHRVREAITAQFVKYNWVDRKINTADIDNKHLAYPDLEYAATQAIQAT